MLYKNSKQDHWREMIRVVFKIIDVMTISSSQWVGQNQLPIDETILAVFPVFKHLTQGILFIFLFNRKLILALPVLIPNTTGPTRS